jgi:hypothetical protein
VPEIIGWSIGPFIVCPQIRDWLEELEPDRHQYIPITVRSNELIQGKNDHGTYYVIVHPPAIQALIIEGTEFWGGLQGREGYVKSEGNLSANPDTPCFIDRNTAHGHHFWRLPNGKGWQHMCSTELWRRISERKFRGLVIEKKCSLQ